MSSRTVYIYALIDPETNQVRYIGKSINPQRRYVEHLNLNTDKRWKNTYKSNWIKSLIGKNLKPDMKILEEANDINWQSRERYWVKFHKEQGCRLTNLTEGGDGIHGMKRGKTSKYKHVHFDVEKQKYQIQIVLPNKTNNTFVGNFDSDKIAAYYVDCLYKYYFNEIPNIDTFKELKYDVIPLSIEQVKDVIKANKILPKSYYVYVDKSKTKQWICMIKKDINTPKPKLRKQFATVEEAIKFGEEYFNNTDYDIGQLKEQVLSNLYKKKSKYRGVVIRGNRYSVETMVNGKYTSVSRHSTELEAALAYNNHVISNNLNKKLNIITS